MIAAQNLDLWIILALVAALAGGIMAAVGKAWALVLVAASAAILAAVQLF